MLRIFSMNISGSSYGSGPQALDCRPGVIWVPGCSQRTTSLQTYISLFRLLFKTEPHFSLKAQFILIITFVYSSLLTLVY